MTDSISHVIKVLVVDDHAMTRTGLSFFLKAFDDLVLVGEVCSGEDALDFCVHTQPDVILMDMVMPGMGGVKATQAILHHYPHIQIIALTSFHERDLIEQALQAGAISYLLKNVSAQDLAQAIRDAWAGQSTLAREATKILVESARQPPAPGDDLTERERDVLTLLVDGLSNAQIAGQLSISLATVKFHIRGILAKLGAANRAEAVTLAWKYRLVNSTPTRTYPKG